MSRRRLITSLVVLLGALPLAARVAVPSFPVKTTSGPLRTRSGKIAISRPSVARAQYGFQRAGGKRDVLKLVHSVGPVYPEEARRQHLQGNVILDATVNEKGEVVNLKLIDGPRLLVKPALDAVRQWKYEPPSQAPAHTIVTVNFALGAQAGPESSNSESGKGEHLTLLSQGHAVIPSDPKCQDEGDVDVEVTVGKKGEVLEAKALSGPECLRLDVVRWVRTFHYSAPARAPAITTFSFGITNPKEANAGEAKSPTGTTKGAEAGSDSTEAVTAPVPIFKPEPPYSDEARKARVEGILVFVIVVDRQGNVSDVRAVSKPLGKGLDESAVNTLRTWKFKPATRGGRPVTVRVQVETKFRLPNDKST